FHIALSSRSNSRLIEAAGQSRVNLYLRFAAWSRSPPQSAPCAHCVRAGGGEREPDADPEEDEWPGRVAVGDDHAADGEVEDPGRGLAQEVDGELIAPRLHVACADDQEDVATEDDDERHPGQAAGEKEQQDGGIDHQTVGQWIGVLAELRLDVP